MALLFEDFLTSYLMVPGMQPHAGHCNGLLMVKGRENECAHA